MAVAGDCRFAMIDEGYVLKELYNATTGSRRGVGFLTFEQLDGSCYYYHEYNLDQEQVVRDYADFLGNDWNLGRIVACMTPVISLFTWLYMWSFTCTAQVLAIRYTIGAILMVVLVTLQGLTFTALTSGWCDDNNCDLSRSSGLSIGAILCFFIAGLCFFCSFNYPGEEDLPVFMATKSEILEPDEEAPEEEAVLEEDQEEEESVKSEEEEEPIEEQAPEAAPEEEPPTEAVPEEDAPLGDLPEEDTTFDDELAPAGSIDVFEDYTDGSAEIET